MGRTSNLKFKGGLMQEAERHHKYLPAVLVAKRMRSPLRNRSQKLPMWSQMLPTEDE